MKGQPTAGLRQTSPSSRDICHPLTKHTPPKKSFKQPVFNSSFGPCYLFMVLYIPHIPHIGCALFLDIGPGHRHGFSLDSSHWSQGAEQTYGVVCVCVIFFLGVFWREHCGGIYTSFTFTSYVLDISYFGPPSYLVSARAFVLGACSRIYEDLLSSGLEGRREVGRLVFRRTKQREIWKEEGVMAKTGSVWSFQSS